MLCGKKSAWYWTWLSHSKKTFGKPERIVSESIVRYNTNCLTNPFQYALQGAVLRRSRGIAFARHIRAALLHRLTSTRCAGGKPPASPLQRQECQSLVRALLQVCSFPYPAGRKKRSNSCTLHFSFLKNTDKLTGLMIRFIRMRTFFAEEAG